MKSAGYSNKRNSFFKRILIRYNPKNTVYNNIFLKHKFKSFPLNNFAKLKIFCHIKNYLSYEKFFEKLYDI